MLFLPLLFAFLNPVFQQPVLAQALPGRDEDFFERKVRPILVNRCQECHGDAKTKGGLKLTSRSTVLEGGGRGPAVVPGKPEESLLIRAIWHSDSPKMPPKDKLKDQQIQILSRWVELGLPWPETKAAASGVGEFRISPEQRKFWSFQPVKDLPVPAVNNESWPQTAIDRFVLAKLEEKRLKPAAQADKRTLIRRATFDLIGLPPSAEEVNAFLADESPEAFLKIMDRLLSSKQYGERWGRHWLDVAHYADTAGETADFPVPEAYLYRNYVIDSFNRDKPYDQFVREQTAGDILAKSGPKEKYAEQVIATGFLAVSRRFGFDPQNYHHLTIEDTIDTVGKSILGLTISCGRCHDHKFDPISSKDYYALYGIFESTLYPFPGSEEKKQQRDFMSLEPERLAAATNEFQSKLAVLQAELKQKELAKAELQKSVDTVGKDTAPKVATAEETKRLAELRAKLATAENSRAQAKKKLDEHAARPPALAKAYAVSESAAKNARIHKRGDPLTPGDEVPRRFPEILGGFSLPAGASGSGRLQLAQWLTDPKNPLTARVMVNRIWQHHFGQGLVRTPSNFGKQGRAPTHPELLDYLAARFIDSGWSVKSMHKLIMRSQAYQLSSTVDSKASASDPANELLSHFHRRRLDAEEIRDSLLVLGGNLDATMAGPHPFPPQQSWGFTQHAPFQAVYDTNRRSVYLMTQRIRRHPFLALFDGPDTNSSTASRFTTTVPTQALYFMNNPFVHEQAAKFANRISQSHADAPGRIEAGYMMAFGRPPSADEMQSALVFLNDIATEARTNKVPIQAVWSSFARLLFSSNEFVHID